MANANFVRLHSSLAIHRSSSPKDLLEFVTLAKKTRLWALANGFLNHARQRHYCPPFPLRLLRRRRQLSVSLTLITEFFLELYSPAIAISLPEEVRLARSRLGSEGLGRLSFSLKRKIGCPFTTNDILRVLRRAKVDSALGPDGLPYEF